VVEAELFSPVTRKKERKKEESEIERKDTYVYLIQCYSCDVTNSLCLKIWQASASQALTGD
jgi:hypothetical protein